MAFRVGQKVVCIREAGWPRWARKYSLPVKGEVYTVRGVFAFSKGPCVYLHELVNHAGCINDDTGEWLEPGFPAKDFRPVVERKTDISIFTAMLTGTKKRRVLALGEG